MEQVLVDDLIKEVRVTLDENRQESSYLKGGLDNMELNEIIRSKLIDAARSILEVCPLNMLEPKEFVAFEDKQIKNDDGSGYVVLPDDFLRLSQFKLNSWNRSVVNAAEEGSAISYMQRNLFTRGTPVKPVCVFAHNASGKRIMEYYTAGKLNDTYDHNVEKALYVQLPSISADNKLGISASLRFHIVNYCAGLVEVSRNNLPQADVFFKIANNFKN